MSSSDQNEGFFPLPEPKKPIFSVVGSERAFTQKGAADSLAGADRTPGFASSRQLDMDDADTRLPWLEGDDEIVEEKAGISQGLLLGGFGALVLALVAGVGYWALAGSSGNELVADGGVIESPKTPYKVRPDNPGGEFVSGTGDTSFAVAEGQSRTPQIDSGAVTAPEPKAAPSVGAAAVAPASVAATDAAVAASAVGVGVQVGAYASREQAEAGWNTLKSQYEPLGGMSHRILQGQADIGTVYRLQAVPGDRAAARALCNNMKAAGFSCQVKG